jgi:hypothetical protein
MVLLPISHLSHVAGAVEALRKTNWLEFNNPSRTTVAECTTIYAMCLARYYSYISRSGLYAETIAYPIHVGQIVYCYVHVGLTPTTCIHSTTDWSLNTQPPTKDSPMPYCDSPCHNTTGTWSLPLMSHMLPKTDLHARLVVISTCTGALMRRGRTRVGASFVVF